MADEEARYSKPDFGAWLRAKLNSKNIPVTTLSAASGIPYPNLSSTINSGKRGNPVQPEEVTIKKIIPALREMGLIATDEEVWVAAGYRPVGAEIVAVPKGYRIIRLTEDAKNFDIPENFEDWPLELQEAMAYSSELSPEAQRYVYSVWREQAREHAELARRKIETEQEIEKARQELDRIRGEISGSK